jgi:hypothetical protein
LLLGDPCQAIGIGRRLGGLRLFGLLLLGQVARLGGPGLGLVTVGARLFGQALVFERSAASPWSSGSRAAQAELLATG